jgi:hypothetical protein
VGGFACCCLKYYLGTGKKERAEETPLPDTLTDAGDGGGGGSKSSWQTAGRTASTAHLPIFWISQSLLSRGHTLRVFSQRVMLHRERKRGRGAGEREREVSAQGERLHSSRRAPAARAASRAAAHQCK